jgi:hypothetical protein
MTITQVIFDFISALQCRKVSLCGDFSLIHGSAELSGGTSPSHLRCLQYHQFTGEIVPSQLFSLGGIDAFHRIGYLSLPWGRVAQRSTWQLHVFDDRTLRDNLPYLRTIHLIQGLGEIMYDGEEWEFIQVAMINIAAICGNIDNLVIRANTLAVDNFRNLLFVFPLVHTNLRIYILKKLAIQLISSSNTTISIWRNIFRHIGKFWMERLIRQIYWFGRQPKIMSIGIVGRDVG